MLVTLTSDDSCYGVVAPDMESSAREYLKGKLDATFASMDKVVMQSCKNIPTQSLITSDYTLAISIKYANASVLVLDQIAADINTRGCDACEACWARGRGARQATLAPMAETSFAGMCGVWHCVLERVAPLCRPNAGAATLR